jgi:hypothetical protein
VSGGKIAIETTVTGWAGSDNRIRPVVKSFSLAIV